MPRSVPCVFVRIPNALADEARARVPAVKLRPDVGGPLFSPRERGGREAGLQQIVTLALGLGLAALDAQLSAPPGPAAADADTDADGRGL